MKDKQLPNKLKHDAIVEALFEIRFDSPAIPELIFGQFAADPMWKGFAQIRLPGADIPVAVRRFDEGLRYQPSVELRNDEQHRLVRIGPQVLSYHRLAPYVGWMAFKPEIYETVDLLGKYFPQVIARRLGLRYVNALRPELHGIDSIAKLDMEVKVGGDLVSDKINLNFTVDLAGDNQGTVRIATRDFVQGTLPDQTSVIFDIDVFTKPGFETDDFEQIRGWIEFAHTDEKKIFSGVLTEETIRELSEQ